MNECLVLDHSIIEEGEEKLSNRVCLLVNIEMVYSCMACCFNISPLQTHILPDPMRPIMYSSFHQPTTDKK